MTQETWLGLGMGFLIAAGLVLIGMVLSWLEERERKKQPLVVEEHTQLVGEDCCDDVIPMPGMGQCAVDFETFNQDLWGYRPYPFSYGFTRGEAEKLYGVMCRASSGQVQTESEEAHE